MIILLVIQLKNSYDMIKFAANVEAMAIFLPKQVFKAKDDSDAQKDREKGNEFFKKGAFQKAFNHYSMAVMKAEYPDGATTSNNCESTTLAFALGNRSAASFHLKNYEEAIADIHFALSLNYPKKSKLKLYERLGKSHLALGEGMKAKMAFNICKQLTNDDVEALKNIEGLIHKANGCSQQKEM